MSKPSQLAGTPSHPPCGVVTSARCALGWTSPEKWLAPSPGKRAKMLPLAGILVLAVLSLLVPPPAWSQQHPHDEHAGMSMSADGPTEGMLLSWKRESEGNHHLIGLFLVLSGLFISAQVVFGKKFPIMAYVWPTCFLLSGLFVLVYSDTELWPFGPKPWIQGTLTNPEVIQHKVFALLLLGVGLLEMGRVRGGLKAAWVAWVFPVLAVGGSCLLLFHSHHTGMRGPNHMAIMARIHAEHLSYAVTGFGIGLVKGLAEVSTRWQYVFANLWPMLMVVLGVLLMCYAE
jgi:copper resistance protein D